ncbi:hypothetical protein BDV96DRAFT_664925 [Lophiotrema nucula]|uniref:Uncharacterized protein n=1 Tax=Lophiotrema nucula TaxID=690887 RepID=A0A6A5Z0B3_9PLEO|nr:hypothetical protein BDV96DRAFT_664925 [Lophiotrema nucula]
MSSVSWFPSRPEASNSTPDVEYFSREKGHLGLFLYHLHTIPSLAGTFTTIILDENYDNAKDGAVLELVFQNRWNEMSAAVASVNRMTPTPRPLLLDIVRENVNLITLDSSFEAAREDQDPYMHALGALLEVCSNLKVLYLPLGWKDKFPTQKFPRLEYVGTTEELDVVDMDEDIPDGREMVTDTYLEAVQED